jgi:ADP-ribosylglycohydrolase
MLAVIVQQLLSGFDLVAATSVARAELLRWPGHGEQLAALDTAVELASRGRPTPEQLAERLGGGWVGEEALAIAVCAALAARGLPDGLLLAVNHSGDSDSTGSIAGNILGAMHGVGAIPASWLSQLELREVITTLALDAVTEFGAHG